MAVIVVVILFIYSDPQKQNHFTRKKIAENPMLLAEAEMPDDIYGITGMTQQHIFFYCQRPGEFIKADYNFKCMNRISFDISNNMRATNQFRTAFHSGNLYTIAMNVPAVIVYSLTSGNILTYNLQKTFNESVLISPNTVIQRAYAKINDGIQLVPAKVSLRFGGIEWNNKLIREDDEGSFSTHGMFSYDQHNGTVVFSEYYSNHFICLDTNLNLLGRYHTIDTFSTSQVRSVRTKGGGFTLSNPPRVINLKSTAGNGVLYIHSSLRADNENTTEYNDNLILDTYDLKNGVYRGSYYIPKPAGEKVRDINVTNDKMTILLENTAYLYALPV